jgi:integrase
VPSLNVELPRYVIVKRRAIKQAFYFQVPKRLRPDGWAGAYRLPFESLRRSGLADPAEIAAVTADANALYDRLRAERKGEIGYRLNTLPWLIQSFDQKLKKRKKPVPKNTMRNYAYAARQVLAWSLESGHPHVRLIDRPAILAFLETMDETPRKKLLVAAYLRMVMTHAMDKGIRTDNPCAKLGLEEPEAQVHIWTEAEMKTMVEAADKNPALADIGTAILIGYDEGPRPVDILKLQRHIQYFPKEAKLRYQQSKTKDSPETKGWVFSPVGKRVKERLEAQSSTQLMLVVNKNTGKQYNERVFNRDFDRLRKATGLRHLQFRHLRHTFVVNAKRAGLDAFEIASKTGHSPKSVEDMLRKHYLPHDSVVAANATKKMERYRRKAGGA